MGGLVAAAVTAVAALALASPVGAAVVVRDDVDAADVTFTAGPGEANRVVGRLAAPPRVDGLARRQLGPRLISPRTSLESARLGGVAQWLERRTHNP
jgi:hypothetical protein